MSLAKEDRPLQSKALVISTGKDPCVQSCGYLVDVIFKVIALDGPSGRIRWMNPDQSNEFNGSMFFENPLNWMPNVLSSFLPFASFPH